MGKFHATNNMSKIQSIVVLTGSGVSAESGLKTFRDNNGLWEDHRVEEVATPEAFAANPELVHRFYNLRRQQLLSGEVQPNRAHKALADFQKQFAGKLSIITQNVDNLHERAGSSNVIHMHGELLKIVCTRSGKRFECKGVIDTRTQCQCCGMEGTLRPDIVWFGEIPKSMDLIESLLAGCDLFLSIGTSGTVYPAAGFKQVASSFGARTVELNLEASSRYSGFDESYYGLAGDIVPRYLEELKTRADLT
jgi:NAD-dependent deacetylase